MGNSTFPARLTTKQIYKSSCAWSKGELYYFNTVLFWIMRAWRVTYSFSSRDKGKHHFKRIPHFLSYFGKSFDFEGSPGGFYWEHMWYTDFASKIVGILWSKIIGDDWLLSLQGVIFESVNQFHFPFSSEILPTWTPAVDCFCCRFLPKFVLFSR